MHINLSSRHKHTICDVLFYFCLLSHFLLCFFCLCMCMFSSLIAPLSPISTLLHSVLTLHFRRNPLLVFFSSHSFPTRSTVQGGHQRQAAQADRVRHPLGAVQYRDCRGRPEGDEAVYAPDAASHQVGQKGARVRKKKGGRYFRARYLRVTNI
jgi:hypothetical protein